MTTFSCAEVEDRLDLYAAGEIAPDEQPALDAHLRQCPRCARAFAEARSMLDLLDLHWQTPAALERLQDRLEEDTRAQREDRAEVPGPPRTLRFASFVRRFGAVAALLVLAVGLGLLFPTPTPSTSAGPDLAVAVVPAPALPPPLEKMVPAVRGQQEKVMKPPGGSKGVTVPLAEARKGEHGYPLPAEIDYLFEVRNATRGPVRFEEGGPDYALVLDLRGPGVREVVFPGKPEPAREVTRLPGQSLVIPVRRLESRWQGRVRYSYCTRPGDYTLTVRVRLRVREEGKPAEVRYLTGPPLTIQVKEGVTP